MTLILKFFLIFNFFALLCLAQYESEYYYYDEEVVGQEEATIAMPNVTPGSDDTEEDAGQGWTDGAEYETDGEETSDSEDMTEEQPEEEIVPVDLETKLGFVRGRLVDTANGNSIRAFLSVPYAQSPPVRFEKPSALTDNFTQDGTLYEAFRYKPSCARWAPDGRGMDPDSSEDCLYLKILTPDDDVGNFPVMFWLHGGGFNDGAIDSYDNSVLGDNFVSKGVIVVQVPYRQGPLGFFTTGTEEAEGNYAVYDALEALRFVKENVESFGGNPNMITIMGHESGAVMAELLTLSPQAYGLYSSVILLGGTAFDPSIFMNDDVNIKRSQNLAATLGCDGEDMNVLDCLKYDVPVEDLVSAIGKGEIMEELPGSSMCNYYWRPRYDGYYGVLPNTFNDLASGRPRVPTMIGVIQRDWLLELAPFVVMSDEAVLPEDFNETYNTPEFVSQTCKLVLSDMTDIYGEEYVANMTEKCVEHHVTRNMTEVDSPYFWLHKAARVGTGLHLLAPVSVSVEHMKRQNNYKVYLFSFDYDRSSTGDPYWMALGGARGLEMDLLGNYSPQFEFNEKDNEVMETFSNMLTNFATFHLPTPMDSLVEGQKRWTSYITGFMSIDESERADMMEMFYTGDADFWISNQALDEYNTPVYEFNENDGYYAWL